MNIFRNSKLIGPNNQILKHIIPDELFEELSVMVDRAKKKRKSKYAFLLDHVNNGQNSYQTTVDVDLFEKSFFFGYLIKMGEHYITRNHKILGKAPGFYPTDRIIRLRRNFNHFDHYDFWVNFADKGAINPLHDHPGFLSGVIYFTESFKEPTIFDNKFKYLGKEKEILMFPSRLIHEVKTYKGSKTRITLSFNLYLVE
jgi:hypothetical protein